MNLLTLTAPTSVTLIPGQRQKFWGKPAVANFACGGLAAGFYMVAAAAGQFDASPVLTIASWLSPVLVLAGFIAVAAEAGRPWRGLRVLRRVSSSWMSRELWLGGLFVALAGGEFVAPSSGQRMLAAVLAGAFVVAQGLILRQACGIAAWNVAVMPPLFVVSAVLAGTALYTLGDTVTHGTPGVMLLGAILIELPIGAGAWLTYLRASREAAFVNATRVLRQGSLAMWLLVAGYVVPFVLVGLAVVLSLRTSLATLAALFVIGGQIHAKAAIVLSAGQLRPIGFAHPSLHRRPS